MAGSRKSLNVRVTEVAEEVYARQRSVSVIEVCLGLGWLQLANVQDWQYGKVDSLDRFLGSISPENLGDVVAYLRRWAESKGLGHQRALRFFAPADQELESAWHSRWDAPGLSQRLNEKLTAVPDLVVVMPVKSWTCAEAAGALR